MIGFICSVVDHSDDQRFILDLYQNYKQLMFLTARKYVTDETSCEDIMQDSIIKLIQHIDTIRGKDYGKLTSYIISTVKNTSIDYLRKQGRSRPYWNSTDDEAYAGDISEDAPTMDELLLINERRARLYSIWPELSEQDQIALRGKYILGYTDVEIAELLGCQEASVRSRLVRARRRALRLLTQDGREGGAANDWPAILAEMGRGDIFRTADG